jgi:hypothetical protein
MPRKRPALRIKKRPTRGRPVAPRPEPAPPAIPPPEAPRPLPRRATDEHGRLLPWVFEQGPPKRSISEILDEVDRAFGDDPNDTPEVWREFRRTFDEDRPHRPLFEGMDD